MRTSCLMLLVASAILFASSFMTWIQFRPQLPPGVDPQMLDAEMLAMLSANGWRGNVSLAGATVPNWFVPVIAFVLAGIALMRAADIFETPRALAITFASYCVAHLGLLTVVVVFAGSEARLGLGAMIGMLASLGAFGASLIRAEQHSCRPANDPVRTNAGGAGYGRVIGAPRKPGTVDDLPSPQEFDSRPHQRS